MYFYWKKANMHKLKLLFTTCEITGLPRCDSRFLRVLQLVFSVTCNHQVMQIYMVCQPRPLQLETPDQLVPKGF